LVATCSGLDAAGREEQPVQVFGSQGIAQRRREFRLRIALGDIGADRGRFRERRFAVAQRRHLAHRIDSEIVGSLLRTLGNVGEDALVRLADFFHQPQRGE
jgi:hypothetical protein